MIVRQASLEEVIGLIAHVPELEQGHPIPFYQQRVHGKNHLALVSEVRGQLAGFKLGYEVNPSHFYSWVGGVIPEFRNLGLAQELLVAQESLVWSRGYQVISVKTAPRFAAMCSLLDKNGYVVGTRADWALVYEKRNPTTRSR